MHSALAALLALLAAARVHGGYDWNGVLNNKNLQTGDVRAPPSPCTSPWPAAARRQFLAQSERPAVVSLLRVVSACAVSPACLQYADLSAIGSARSAPPRGSHVKNYFCGPRLSLAALRTGPLSLWLLCPLCC